MQTEKELEPLHWEMLPIKAIDVVVIRKVRCSYWQVLDFMACMSMYCGLYCVCMGMLCIVVCIGGCHQLSYVLVLASTGLHGMYKYVSWFVLCMHWYVLAYCGIDWYVLFLVCIVCIGMHWYVLTFDKCRYLHVLICICMYCTCGMYCAYL